MNRSQLFMNKIIFNYKLNREKFINNKNNMNIYNANIIIKRKMHTNTEPPEQGPNFIFMAFIAIVGYSVVKFNKRKSN